MAEKVKKLLADLLLETTTLDDVKPLVQECIDELNEDETKMSSLNESNKQLKEANEDLKNRVIDKLFHNVDEQANDVKESDDDEEVQVVTIDSLVSNEYLL